MARITSANNNQIDIATYTCITEFGATAEVDFLNSKSSWVDSCGDALCEPLSPPPVFWFSTKSFAAELSLFPLEVLTNSVSDIVQQLLLLLKEGAFPSGWLRVLIVNLDGTNTSMPD